MNARQKAKKYKKKIINHSPSKEIKRVFKKTLKRCKKEHKKAKDYEECSYCLWSEFCKCGKKRKKVNADGDSNKD